MIRETGTLVRHSLVRFRTPLLVMAAALAAFQVLLGLAAQELQREGAFTQIANLIPVFVRQLFGTALVSIMSFSGIMALGYYHVAIVAVLVGLVVAIATEPAGEVEGGFADLVLSRSVWLLAFGLWCVLVCWGGVSLAIGSVARRRFVAGSIAGGGAAALMLVDYLSRVWKPIRGLARLSPFHYYNPLDLVMNKPLPRGDEAILLGAAAVAVVVAYALFSRRDL
jgi:hypothetical protein